MTKEIFSSEDELQIKFLNFFKNLKAQDIVLLNGPIGSGKTTFVKNFVAYLIDIKNVSEKSNNLDPQSQIANSPSYNVIQEYILSDLKVIHIDLYRIEDIDDLESIGFWDVLTDKQAIFFIEWPDLLEVNDLGRRTVYDLQISLSTEAQSLSVRSYLIKNRI